MICSKCGSENSEGSIFCNKCGAKLQAEDMQTDIIIESKEPQAESQIDSKDNTVENKNLKFNKLKNIFKKKKVLIPTLIICCFLVIISIGYLAIKPPAPEKVFQKIKGYKTEDLIVYLDKVYPQNGGFLGLFKQKNREDKSKVLQSLIKNIDQEFESQTGRSISDYNAVKITNVDIANKSYSSDYVDINVTVNNGGTTPINYIKVNLYFKDENGNIVRSDWTNDDSNIQPGANQVLTKMTENDGWHNVSAEIAEIK